jgi:hypothetical protein
MRSARSPIAPARTASAFCSASQRGLPVRIDEQKLPRSAEVLAEVSVQNRNGDAHTIRIPARKVRFEQFGGNPHRLLAGQLVILLEFLANRRTGALPELRHQNRPGLRRNPAGGVQRPASSTGGASATQGLEIRDRTGMVSGGFLIGGENRLGAVELFGWPVKKSLSNGFHCYELMPIIIAVKHSPPIPMPFASSS